MASTTVQPAPHLNGSGVAPDSRHEAEFLEKLLQLRDEVLASKHPRIHLPPAVLERIAPRPTTQQPPPQPASTGVSVSRASAGSHPSQIFPPRPESSSQNQILKTEYGSSANAARPFSAKSASSGIDPVLLTKSDHLIRAELQLKRLQIERTIKDQFDRKGRANDTTADDREPYFDVEDALAKAQALVKPLSVLQPAAQSSEGSTSFDENSYYSSRANSWSPERDDSNQTTRSANAAEVLASQANLSPPEVPLTAASDGLPTKDTHRATQPAVIDLEEDAYEPTEDIEVYEPEPAKVHEEQEESDYSPPPAAAGHSVPNQGRPREHTARRNGGTNGSSRRQSPAGNAPPLQNPRKRRREERKRQLADKRGVRSPEPYIKEEPQSPPPFSSYPDAQPNKRRALQPLTNNLEVEATHGRTQPTHYFDQEHSPRSYRPYEGPLSPTVIHVPQRRVERDDQDLRRVASLQNARRPHSPGGLEPYHAVETRPIRGASHAFAERPVEPVYHEMPSRPSAAPRYVRDRSRSPVQEYISRPQSPVMAPPSRRIVVDQFGNKYYAAPVNVRESVAPSRRIEAEPYYERAMTREPIRAPPRTEVYEEDGMMMMPPPPPRRYVEVADTEVVETRPYRQREASHRPMEVEYSGRSVVERRPVMQYEEIAPPREYIRSRAYSMRPEGARREVAEGYPSMRHESVAPRYVSVAAPRYREVSVVHAEGQDDHRYTFATPAQGRRYVEEGATERPIEVAQESYSTEPRRVSYRY